jgi:hypothetical protein
MKANREVAIKQRTARPGSAIKAVLQFCLRYLTPADRPPSSIHKAPPVRLNEPSQTMRRQTFSTALFAELLLELPTHRNRLVHTWECADIDALGNAIHQLLGAVAYCDAPELEEALRELRLAIKTAEPETIDSCHVRAISAIDTILHNSGYQGRGTSGQT